jgi:hypothetical protein
MSNENISFFDNQRFLEAHITWKGKWLSEKLCFFFQLKNCFAFKKLTEADKRMESNNAQEEKPAPSKWVHFLNIHQISSSWTLNECLFFLMLSPTTQKKLGAFEDETVTKGTTEGLFRFLAVQRIIAILYPNTAAAPNAIYNLMPYSMPKKLGNAYGHYQVIQRHRLGQYCQHINSHLGLALPRHNSNHNDGDIRTASFINAACAAGLHILKH